LYVTCFWAGFRPFQQSYLVSRFESGRGFDVSKLRLTITMSLDGYVAGPDQSEENPLGVGGMALHEWFFPLKEFREMHGEQGGETNASSSVVEERRQRTVG
jgi:hypothetical protein